MGDSDEYDEDRILLLAPAQATVAAPSIPTILHRKSKLDVVDTRMINNNNNDDDDDDDECLDDTTTGLQNKRLHVERTMENHPLLQEEDASRITSCCCVHLHLDQQEEDLFEVLVRATEDYENGLLELPTNRPSHGTYAVQETPSTTTALQVRVAGGWVRDKILQLETHDVDIAIDRLTGVEFATLVQEYCNRQYNQNSSSSLETHKKMTTGRMGVIKANPDQSKHLETATMKVCGMEVDFCNLRGEHYEDHSRIPTVAFGGPKDDAYRRDFTCNALFYNLRTQTVEDWTGRGFRDLREGTLVTPLEPVKTFRDDPLRVLRAVRFAVRYNFRLDKALEDACQLDEIHKALHRKVSRERIGKELEGMLSGKHAKPVVAIGLIGRLKLAGPVFMFPRVGNDNVISIGGSVLGEEYLGDHDCNEARHVREAGWGESQHLLHCLPPIVTKFNRISNKGPSNYDVRLLPLGVFLSPFRHLYYELERKKDKRFSVIEYIFREGIKFKNLDTANMSLMLQNLDEFIKVLEDMKDPTKRYVDRVEAGLLLRNLKSTWVSCMLVAICFLVRRDGIDSWYAVMEKTYKGIIDQGLDESWKIRPLIDGKELIAALQLPRGPEIAVYLDHQVRWVLGNPEGTKEACMAYLMSLRKQSNGDTL